MQIFVQNLLAYGGDVCDTNVLPLPLFTPSSHSLCAPPQDMFFIGDDFPVPAAAESRQQESFFGGDMGSVSEHELKWDDFSMATTTTTNPFSTTTTDMLCRQASDGIDDLAAYFFPDETRVVF